MEDVIHEPWPIYRAPAVVVHGEREAWDQVNGSWFGRLYRSVTAKDEEI
jgi:hypothetical protein